MRAVVGLALFAVAAVRRDPTLNYVGLGVYWVLDVLDGYLARRLDQETRFGAQLDILCDRLLVSCFYLNYLYLDDRPGTVVPIALFLIQFMVIDHYLSNQFLGTMPAPQVNVGGDGTGVFTGTVGQVNLNNFAGNQYFIITRIPEPTTLALVALTFAAAAGGSRRCARD